MKISKNARGSEEGEGRKGMWLNMQRSEERLLFVRKVRESRRRRVEGSNRTEKRTQDGKEKEKERSDRCRKNYSVKQH